MNRLLLIFLITRVYCFELYSQNSSELLIQLFENNQNKIDYKYTYEFHGEGENTIGKTEITNNLSFEKVNQIRDTTWISITSDSTKISNKNSLEDGEVSLLFATIGLNMEVQIWGEGESIEILNKEEVVKEFEKGIVGLSSDARRRMVEKMLEENEELIYAKLYEINYGLILKYIGKTIKFPMYEEKDSIMESGLEKPRTTIKIIKESELLPEINRNRIKTTTTSQTEPFTEVNETYTIESNSMNSILEELVEVKKSGQVERVELKSIQEHNGFKMKINGEVRQEMKPITEYLNIRIIQIN